jgi:hypothetical protein
VSILSSSSGKWSGFYSLKKPAILIGSFCQFTWTAQKIQDHGYFCIETLEPSRMSHHWSQAILMTAFGMICESGTKFIPDGIKNLATFELLKASLENITHNTVYSVIKTWENHILVEYMDHLVTKTADNLDGFIRHCKQTKILDTKLRNDFIAIIKL